MTSGSQDESVASTGDDETIQEQSETTMDHPQGTFIAVTTEPTVNGKACYQSVSGLTGTVSNRCSGSPVPALTGEVVHRLDPTGSPSEPDIPVEMRSQ
jgi:hypothetical protein